MAKRRSAPRPLQLIALLPSRLWDRFSSKQTTGCFWRKPAGALPAARRNHNLSPRWSAARRPHHHCPDGAIYHRCPPLCRFNTLVPLLERFGHYVTGGRGVEPFQLSAVACIEPQEHKGLWELRGRRWKIKYFLNTLDLFHMSIRHRKCLEAEGPSAPGFLSVRRDDT